MVRGDNTFSNTQGLVTAIEDLLGSSNPQTIDFEKQLIKYGTHPNELPIFFTELDSNRPLWRSRAHHEPWRFHHVDQIKYRSSNSIKSLGRVNREGQSIFYCSEHQETCIREVKENLFPATRRFFVTVCQWRFSENFEIPFIISSDPRAWETPLEKKLGKELIDHIDYHVPPSNQDAYKLFFKFMADKYAESDHGRPNLYKFTSTYSHLILNDSKSAYPGIVFPSVADVPNLRGANLGIKPELIDSGFIFPGIIFRKELLFQHDGEYEELETIVAKRIKKDGRIIW